MTRIHVPDGFRIIAHRGASAYAPENTRAAFEAALALGVQEVELDVQLSADGVVVVCHDRTLERYGHGPLVVEETHLSQLLALDMGTWFSPEFAGERMLTLDNLIRCCGAQISYHIEIKGSRTPLVPEIVRIISMHKLGACCIVTSFSLDSLERTRAVEAALRLGWLVPALTPKTLDTAAALGLHQLCPRADGITREAVSRAKEIVPEVRAWGLRGSPECVRTLIHRVVDAGCDGMTINWPDWVAPKGADQA